MDDTILASDSTTLPVSSSEHSPSSLVFNKVYNRVIPPLQSSFSQIVSPQNQLLQTSVLSNADTVDAVTDDDEIDAAATGTKSLKNLLSYLSTSQLYSEVNRYIQSHRSGLDSDVKPGAEQGPGSTFTPGATQKPDDAGRPGSKGCLILGYGVAESSSEEDDYDGYDRDDESSISEQEFEDAEDLTLPEDSGFSERDVRDDQSDSTLRILNAMPTKTPNSGTTKGSSLSSIFGSTKSTLDEVDMSKLSTFQKSVVDNFEAYPRDSVLMKFTDDDQDTKPSYTISDKMKVNIADRLQRVFNLDDNDYFYSNYNAWLVRDVFLQGHIYVTKNCLLFFAFLADLFPKPVADGEDDFERVDDSSVYIQSGALTMKAKKYGEILGSVLTDRFWAILRPGTLSIYSSPTDLYFPSLVIDLRSCLKVEILDKYQPKTESQTLLSPLHESPSFLHPEQKSPSQDEFNDEEELTKLLALEAEENKESISGGVWFKITTEKKSYKFQTDNLYSARQWVNNITKIIFQLHNTNSKNEVLIKIPFERFGQIKKGNLFNTNFGTDFGAYADKVKSQMPSAFAFLYTTGAEQHSNTKKFQRKLQEKTKQNTIKEIDWLHFAFFSSTTKFEEVITKILKAQVDLESLASDNIISRMTKKQRSPETNLPNTTLLPFGNHSAILEQIIDANKNFFDLLADEGIQRSNSDSKIKKISKTLSTKVLGTKSKDTLTADFSGAGGATSPIYNSGSSSVISPQISTNFPSSDTVLSSGSTSPVNLNLPRQLSLTGLKNLNMMFETTRRDADFAAIRYKDDSSSIPTSAFPGPLTLSDPSEYEHDLKKESKLNTIGKSIKAISTFTTMWNAQPSHFVELMENDPYLVESDIATLANKRFKQHFSLAESHTLSASYYCHVQRALPVYGKLYVGNDMICFRSLLPGVSTRMLLPLNDVENCFKQRGSKMSYSCLVLIIKGHEKLLVDFSNQKSRDDCLDMILEMLHQFHGSESWKPMAHEWGRNYDLELGRMRLEDEESISSFSPSNDSLKQATSRIESARIKLFEDKLSLAAGLQVPIVLEDSPFIKTEIRPNTSYHFVLLTIGSRGDVQPYIALGKGLIEEGHKVTIATHAEFKDWINKHGIGFKEVAGDPTELMSLMVTHGSMSLAFIKEASAKFKGWIVDLLRTSWEACQGADILIESPSAMAGIHIAEALGIPYMRAFTMPWTRTRTYSHAFILPEQKKSGSYNYLTHVMFETVFWKGISSQVNKWRVDTLRLRKTNLFRLQQYKVPFLYNVSSTVLAPAVDFPDWVKVTGYWFLDEGNTTSYTPPPELVKFMNAAGKDQKKIVYIGFGSIVVNDSKSLTEAIVEAVLDADVRCILNKGWSDRTNNNKEVEIELPPEIFNISSIPHDWLFPRIDAAVHHGGSGTTGASLRSGLPTIIKPFFGDQFFYGLRVEEIGAGISLKKLNAKSLSKALKTVTTDIKIIERAKSIREQIKNEHGVLSAIETIYSELEYARSLVLNKQLANEQVRLRSGTNTYVNTPQNEELSDSEDSITINSSLY